MNELPDRISTSSLSSDEHFRGKLFEREISFNVLSVWLKIDDANDENSSSIPVLDLEDVSMYLK